MVDSLTCFSDIYLQGTQIAYFKKSFDYLRNITRKERKCHSNIECDGKDTVGKRTPAFGQKQEYSEMKITAV